MKSTLALIFITLSSILSSAATYKGESIDGKKYECTVKSEKEIFSGKVEFHQKRATIYLKDKTIEVKLESETIENPTKIYGWNEQGDWELNVSL